MDEPIKLGGGMNHKSNLPMANRPAPQAAQPESAGPGRGSDRKRIVLIAAGIVVLAAVGFAVVSLVPGVGKLVSAGGVSVEVLSSETVSSYQGLGFGECISAKPGHKLLVLEVRFKNGTPSWATFSSTKFSVVDQAGQTITQANLVAIDKSLVPEGGTVTINNKVSDRSGVEFARYSGKLSAEVSVMDWDIGPHRDFKTTIVYVVPDQSKYSLKIKP